MKRCITLAAGALVCVTAGLAYQPDYFPLNPGNRWVYRQTGAVAGDPMVIEVLKGDVLDNRWYALVSGFPVGPTWLRLGDDGTLYAYDPEQKVEHVWVAFDAAEGSTYATEITSCNKQARVQARAGEWKGGIGEFKNALIITYLPSECADAGILTDVFLPYVGLVERTVNTIAGPLKYELIYANLGGVTFVSAPELSFALTIDRFTYSANLETPTMTARLTLRNVRLEPFTLTFPSSQRFDLAIKDADGNVVYRWSDGKIFALTFGEMEVGSGELNYAINVPLAGGSGKALPAGKYTAEGWLTNTPPARFASTVGFEISDTP